MTEFPPKNSAYGMRLKDFSVWYLDSNGGVLYDGSRAMSWEAPHTTWRILGFSKRFHSHTVIKLANSIGEDLGQGWIHDFDHGTHRVWGSPRARKIDAVWRVNP